MEFRMEIFSFFCIRFPVRSAIWRWVVPTGGAVSLGVSGENKNVGDQVWKNYSFTIVRRGMNKYVEFLQRYMRFCDGSGEKNVSEENREMCEVYYFLERIFD